MAKTVKMHMGKVTIFNNSIYMRLEKQADKLTGY